MSVAHTVLVVDDDPSICDVLTARLESRGYDVVVAGDGVEALEKLSAGPVDLVISDVRMPGLGGRELLAEIRGAWPDVPVILLTAYGTIRDAVQTVRDGAADYLTKPFDGQELMDKVARQLEDMRPHAEAGVDAEVPLAGLLVGGRSEATRQLFGLVRRVAASDVNVLVTGESGTGKEMVAQALHQLSSRWEGPFVVVDCGATPANLLESELFGHAKGSFTHAVKDKKGLIQEAAGGTLFLDEIGNISSEMQTRLLRFLEQGTIRRIGETREQHVDCRVLAATNADLPELVRQGEFREDLYYRLKVITLHVPPLRERPEDIPLLSDHFLARYHARVGAGPSRVGSAAMQRLQAHSWPGNVRELRHVVEAGAVLSDGDVLDPELLQLEEHPLSRACSLEGALTLEESEHRSILRALEQANWVQKDAADLLGISRRALHYKIKKYAIEIPRRRVR
jgi:DNA-binding NtrC family response regulator